MAKDFSAGLPDIYILKKAFCLQLAIFFIALNCLFPQSQKLTFVNFSDVQDLPAPVVTGVLQDKTGLLWFTTWGGLVRYDGYNFLSYRHDPDNPSSIVNTYLTSLLEDKEGILWIGTWKGLERFDPGTGIFTLYTPHKQASGTEWSNRVISVFEDSYGTFWAGTAEGLNVFNKKEGTFTAYYHNSSDPGSISHNSINIIYEDKKRNLWFGTGGGLDLFDRKSGKFIHYWHDPVNQTPYDDWGTSKYWIKSICEDDQGILWLASYGGLIRFDPETISYTHYYHDPKNPKGLHGTKLNDVAMDPSGILWICIADSGIDAFNRKTNTFTHYSHVVNDPSSPLTDRVNVMLCERSGTIWFTTEKGIIKLNKPRETIKKYLFGDIKQIIKTGGDTLYIQNDDVWKVFDTKTEKFSPFPISPDYVLRGANDGSLWIGRNKGGIYKRDKTGHITLFYDSSGKEFTGKINTLCESADGTVWLGTAASGFYFIDPATHLVKQKENFKAYINGIYEDSYGLLWIATNMEGFLCYNKQSDSITELNNNSVKSLDGNFNTVLYIYEDTKRNLWFCTTSGLIQYDRSQKKFSHFTVKEGLVSNLVMYIIEDDHGNFWLSTIKGITKFDPLTKKIKNYDVSDGLPAGGFNEVSACKTANGEMFFGGPDGFIRFNSDSIKDNLFVPPVVITSFRKFDKPFLAGKEVKLNHDDNFISFEFSALSYVSSERNQYKYKMEGLDKDWIYSRTRRYASYPNLAPGEYTFRVKGSNNDGIWNQTGASIKIIILPPWWKTWWAYIAYGLVFLTGVYFLRRYELNRLALKNQIKLDEAVLKEREETDKMKSRFFANISHEFRTPLTLIQGPADKIISRSADETIINNANLIKRNSNRLLQLINQLLDLSKIEAGKLKLEASKGNIVSFVKGVAFSFESLADSKNIALKFNSAKEIIELYFDREKMVKVFSNILSNAFKFTPEDGKITISISEMINSEERGTVEIKIRDTGIGVAPEELPKLFDRFYQVDGSHTREYEGTGIGLALTKELVEMHSGTISVQSLKAGLSGQPGLPGQAGFTEFTIVLPKGKEHLKGEEIIYPDGKTAGELKVLADDDSALQKSISNESPDNEIPEDKTIILIVEDNYDMREYIRDSLSEDNYFIEEAINGEQGLIKAMKIIPDLIICDMMMPKMDGNALLFILKNDERTSHIPVILLTARSAQENKLEGLKSGADDYLTKPFDVKELRIRISNLIQIRKKLQEKFSRGEYLQKQEDKKLPQLKTIDQEFLKRIMQVIEKHISDEEFSIEEFGSEAGMSRMQLHRKLKALTGKSASLYLRSVRLQKARKMIEEQNETISEIAYSVGFSSPAYFSKCYKEEFGYPPTETIK